MTTITNEPRSNTFPRHPYRLGNWNMWLPEEASPEIGLSRDRCTDSSISTFTLCPSRVPESRQIFSIHLIVHRSHCPSSPPSRQSIYSLFCFCIYFSLFSFLRFILCFTVGFTVFSSWHRHAKTTDYLLYIISFRRKTIHLPLLDSVVHQTIWNIWRC